MHNRERCSEVQDALVRLIFPQSTWPPFQASQSQPHNKPSSFEPLDPDRPATDPHRLPVDMSAADLIAHRDSRA